MLPPNKNLLSSQVSEYREADPCFLSRQEIEQMAEDLSKRLGLFDGTSLDDAVNSLGGKTYYLSVLNAKEHDDGSICVRRQGDFDVFLSPFTAYTRDKFTIGHELGHYFLHYPLIQAPMRASRYGTGRREWECNWFSAAFLMPTDIFRSVCGFFSNDLSSVAKAFGLSRKAASIRAKHLNIVLN